MSAFGSIGGIGTETRGNSKVAGFEQDKFKKNEHASNQVAYANSIFNFPPQGGGTSSGIQA